MNKEIVHIYLFVDQGLKESVHKVEKKLDGSLNVLLDTDTVESISNFIIFKDF